MWYNIDHIRHDKNIGTKSLNGPEGSVSAATVDRFWIYTAESNTENLDYRNINMLSCMALYL